MPIPSSSTNAALMCGNGSNGGTKHLFCRLQFPVEVVHKVGYMCPLLYDFRHRAAFLEIQKFKVVFCVGGVANVKFRPREVCAFFGHAVGRYTDMCDCSHVSYETSARCFAQAIFMEKCVSVGL